MLGNGVFWERICPRSCPRSADLSLSDVTLSAELSTSLFVSYLPCVELSAGLRSKTIVFAAVLAFLDTVLERIWRPGVSRHGVRSACCSSVLLAQVLGGIKTANADLFLLVQLLDPVETTPKYRTRWEKKMNNLPP